MLYLGISIFLGLITLVLPPLGLLTVPAWIALTILTAIVALFKGVMR